MGCPPMPRKMSTQPIGHLTVELSESEQLEASGLQHQETKCQGIRTLSRSLAQPKF